jgi:hypothetical protein
VAIFELFAQFCNPCTNVAVRHQTASGLNDRLSLHPASIKRSPISIRQQKDEYDRQPFQDFR